MPINDAIAYLVIWSLIGAVLFSAFVVFVFRSGVVYAARKEDGTLKEKVPLLGYLVMASFLTAVVIFFVTANYFGLARSQIRLQFGALFALNFAHYVILFLFDTFFVDAFVLAYWRPSFLRLSSKIGPKSMRDHIIKSLPIGTGFGILLAGLVTTISFFLMMT